MSTGYMGEGKEAALARRHLLLTEYIHATNDVFDGLESDSECNPAVALALDCLEMIDAQRRETRTAMDALGTDRPGPDWPLYRD
jgi:hypothetical protein